MELRLAFDLSTWTSDLYQDGIAGGFNTRARLITSYCNYTYAKTSSSSHNMSPFRIRLASACAFKALLDEWGEHF